MAFHPMFILTLCLHSPINEHCWHFPNILMHILCTHISMGTLVGVSCYHPSRSGVVGRAVPMISCCLITIPQLRGLKQPFGSEDWLVLQGVLLLRPHAVAGKWWPGLESSVGSSALTSDAWAEWLCGLGPDSVSLSTQPLPVACVDFLTV